MDLLFYTYSDLALLLGRILVAIVILHYGLPKLKDLRSNAKDFDGMGFRPGWLWGTVVAAVEFLGGIALLLGLYVGIAALLIGLQMIVGTIWKIKARKPFSDYSYDLLLLGLVLIFLTFGPGIYSIIQ